MPELTFQQLTEQVQRLTQRVTALEHELGLRRAAEQLPAEVTQTVVTENVAEEPEPRAMRPERAPNLESNIGLRLVNRVGAVTLLLGIAFFFRYAVDKNWIGESARILLGLLAGALLLAGGEFAFRRAQRIFAQGITGAGAGILYLSFYAAFGSYHLIALPTAIFCLGAVTALSGYLALRYSSEAIALLALAGGLLAPLILDTNSLSRWFLPLYVGALDAGFLAVSTRRRWRSCSALALVGTALFTFGMAELPLRFLLPVYYALFATRADPLLFAAAHALFLARVSVSSVGAVYAPQLLALSFAGLAVVRWRAWFQFSSFLVLATGVSWFLASGMRQFALPGAFMTLTALFAMFFAAAYFRAPAGMPGVEAAAIPLNAAIYFAACYAKLRGWGDSWAALLAMLLAGLHFAAAYRWRALPLPNLPALMNAGVCVAFLTLAVPLQLHTFRIIVAWALEGAALVWLAAKRHYANLQLYGFLVLFAAFFQFGAMDFWPGRSFADDPLIFNARFFTAAGLAVAFFLAALWSKGTVVGSSFPGIVGHLLLLTAIGVEVSRWAMRFHRASYANVTSAGISIVFAIYAVVLVALGTGTRAVGHRYVGLVLILLVVVKLYLYDVWQLDPGYRFVAFAALGALLLAMSFLYSRFRDRLASWLKTESASPAEPPQL